MDAVVSAWLARDFLFACHARVQFVSRSQVPRYKDSADCLVDVGQEYDPTRLRFDHRPPAFNKRTDSCAAKLVWEYLIQSGVDVAHLAGLVQLTHDGDSGRSSQALRDSRRSGAHARLEKLKATYPDDNEVFGRMVRWLRRKYHAPPRPMLQGRRSPGSYVLVMQCSVETSVQVGRLGVLNTTPGFYLYVGSALGPGGIPARVNRHLRWKMPDQLKWHVDYIANITWPVAVWYSYGQISYECKLSHAVAGMADVSIPLPRFGASDCRCNSHLYYIEDESAVAALHDKLRTRCETNTTMTVNRFT